ncbi:hypothetical protein LCGC14_2195020 [marine sediment metagenome]|uniref:Uncharacterized protein n=1 Tax=marine sediment metagenome TaxID=412755 RepID=A0A0F9GE68_9ZZZZ
MVDKPDVKRRTPPGSKEEAEPKPEPVSAGPVDKIVELVYNPTRKKIKEMTFISVEQGRLFPQLDIIDLMWQHVIEVATFRQDQDNYARVYGRPRPIPPNLIEEFTYSSAQWQKSIGGTNLKSATDIALAEIETKGDSEGDGLGSDGFST